MEGDLGMNRDPSDPRGTGTTPEEAEGERDTRSTPEIVRSTIWYAIGAVLLTLAGLWFLDQQRTLINYLILAVLLALALEPAVTWLHERRRWRRGSATGLLLVVLFVASVLFVVGLAAVIARESASIVEELPTYVDKLNDFTKDKFDTTVISADQRAAAANAATEIVDFLKEHQEEFLGGIASGLSAIFVLFTVGLFTFYLTAQGPQVRRAILSRMRPERQRRALFALETAIAKMGGYLYSRLLLALINGALLYLTLKILGVPFALPLAMLSGAISEFIPIVGTYIGGALPLIVALGEIGTTAAIVVLIEIVVYQQVENYFLSPRISAKTIELNPGVAFGAAIAGGAVGGFTGAFFALPVTATIQTFIGAYSTSYEVEESALTQVDRPPSDPPKRERRRFRARSKPGGKTSPQQDPVPDDARNGREV
jgi:predicted PurR-regulated permease PerM